jgi:ferredoxin
MAQRAASETAGGAGAAAPGWLPHDELQRLIDALRQGGRRVLGPVVREGALLWDEIARVSDLPVGWRDEQAPGAYRLRRNGGAAVFGVVNGHAGVKPHVFTPREPLLRIQSDGPGSEFQAAPELPPVEPTALLGVRACDLAALAIQDRIFLHDRFPDPHYAARRASLFLVAVGCTRAVATCFCTSTRTGPEPQAGYDLALTELAPGDGAAGFVVRAGSEPGRALVAELQLAPAGPEELERERAGFDACERSMQRSLPLDGLRDLLYANLRHPRWDAVAECCLSCGNCTMVCPTCFCHDVRDEPSLDARESLRVRSWSSCFDPDHAQVHGLNFRPHTRERYRQWLVHKLAGWVDQFEVSGCVGCGRCVTWCPVGIDLTEEVAAIAASPGREP